MQAEAIKKRNAIIGKYQLKLLDINEEKVVLEGELKKLQIIMSEKEKESDSLLKAER